MQGHPLPEIRIKSVRELDDTDENVWAVVRSGKGLRDYYRHVSALSPSWELFQWTRQTMERGQWNHRSFNDIYAPRFLSEMAQPEALQAFTQLIREYRIGWHHTLICYCPDETLCHRCILAGILQGLDLRVSGARHDYRVYWQYFLRYFPAAADTLCHAVTDEMN